MKKFRAEFKKFEAKDEFKALAVYIGCYYHHKNSELQDSFAKVFDNPDFKKLKDRKVADFEERTQTLLEIVDFKDY
jgi:hypothetical protein